MRSSSPPNILMITTDQQRFDTIGRRAPSFMRAPHLQQIACEGITFESAYSDCPVCVPSRVSMMTGKYVTTHGLTGNGPTSSVMGRDDTLPGILRSYGYQTAAIGKMHFGPQRCRHGFDEMILPDDYYREMRESGEPLQPMRHGLGQNEMYPGLSTVPEAQTLTSWTAEETVKYIRERRDPTVPFFAWCSFSKPHPPFDPPEPYYSMYRGQNFRKPARSEWSLGDECPPIFRQTQQGMKYDLISEEIWPEVQSAYHGLVTQIDYNIGRVMGALNDMGLYKDTIIIFTSDHGELLGDHNNGSKCYFYEGSAHVPMLLKLPSHSHGEYQGLNINTPVTMADILPTLVHLAGGDVSDRGLDGHNLLDVAKGRSERKVVVGLGGANVRCAAIMDGRWKYIYYPEGACEQLFDLENDPYEEQELSRNNEFQEQRSTLKTALIEELTSRGSDLVQDGQLVQEEFIDVPTPQLRAGCGSGFHTDQWPEDVRH